MKKALIWDLDGTIVDSYKSIIDSLYIMTSNYGLSYSKEEIRKEAVTKSVSSVIKQISKRTNENTGVLKKEYSEITYRYIDEIALMNNIKETFEQLQDKGIKSYIYTHRGLSTHRILKNNHMENSFVEIVTSKNGFERKPSGQAIDYLVEKYSLDKEHTYYIGDRKVDMESANDSGVRSIFYNSNAIKVECGEYKVKDISEILDIID